MSPHILFPSWEMKILIFLWHQEEQESTCSVLISHFNTSMTYKSLHKPGSIHSPTLCQYLSHHSLAPATDLFSVSWGNRGPFCLSTLHMFFLLTEYFPHISSHCHSLVSMSMSSSGRMLLREVSTLSQNCLAHYSLFHNFFTFSPY